MTAGSAVIATADAIAGSNHAATLSPAAIKVAAQPIPTAYSPIVLAGTVRLVELALIMLVGAAVYVRLSLPIHGLELLYVGGLFGCRRARDAGISGRRYLPGS